MHGCMTPNSKFSNRTLKKSASFVLASLRDSTYRKGTPRPPRSLRPRWTGFLSILLTDAWALRIDLAHQYTKPTL